MRSLASETIQGVREFVEMLKEKLRNVFMLCLEDNELPKFSGTKRDMSGRTSTEEFVHGMHC